MELRDVRIMIEQEKEKSQREINKLMEEARKEQSRKAVNELIDKYAEKHPVQPKKKWFLKFWS